MGIQMAHTRTRTRTLPLERERERGGIGGGAGRSEEVGGGKLKYNISLYAKVKPKGNATQCKLKRTFDVIGAAVARRSRR